MEDSIAKEILPNIFNAMWDPKCLQFILQECKIYQFVYIRIYVTVLALKDKDYLRCILKPVVYKRLYKNFVISF